VPVSAYERLHVTGTRNLLDACREQRWLQAVVHCSTTGVLGPTGPRPADEDAPPHPANVYERTKAEAEGMALDAARVGLPLTVARPALVYGPGDLHMVGWFRAIKAGLYLVVGRGDNLLHPIYVSDVVDGILRCAERQESRGRTYHLVGAQPVPISGLAAAIAEAVHRPLPRTHLPRAIAYATAAILERLPGVPPTRLPLTRNRVDFMTESRVYDGERARAELGFVPRVDLEHGLASTVDWYRNTGLL
jgi:dihydroflavonol-4-reductase